jgi:hypothetical protein
MVKEQLVSVTAKPKRFQQLLLKVLRMRRKTSSLSHALVQPFPTQFRVRLQLELYYFVQLQREPVSSPVVLFVRFWSVREFTMCCQRASVLQTHWTSFTQPLKLYVN